MVSQYRPGYEPGDILEKYYTVGQHLCGYEVLDDDITINCNGKRGMYWEDKECPRCGGYDTCLLNPKTFKFYSRLDSRIVMGGWHCVDCGLVWQVTNISAAFEEPWC